MPDSSAAAAVARPTTPSEDTRDNISVLVGRTLLGDLGEAGGEPLPFFFKSRHLQKKEGLRPPLIDG